MTATKDNPALKRALCKHSFYKVLVLFFSIFLFSCSRSSHWTTDQMHSSDQNHRSTRLSYFSHDPLHGIDLEFLQTPEHLKAYLNVHSMPVPPISGNPKSSLVKLKIHTETLSFQAYRLEGGQRFLLPDEITKTLIEALTNGQEVSISLSGYNSLVKAEDFSKKFEHFQHPFPLKNPFHLPL